MTRYASDGKVRVAWVTSIANIASPTAAELNAGTNLSTFLAKDGVNPGLTPNMVDSATIADTFDAQGVGSYGASLTLTMYRDDTADTAWNLCVYGTTGYVVIRRGVASGTTFSASQKVEVYPAQMHAPLPMQTAANEQVKFTEQFAVTSEPNLKATVA